MDHRMQKPYIAEYSGKAAVPRQYCYDFETLKERDIFPYLVLDGGAFLFASDRFGDASSAELLRAVYDGRLRKLLTAPDGSLDWGISYHTAAATGMPKQHEWQSWPQRLYMLLPLAQEALRGSAASAALWMEIFRSWRDDSPYEPLDYSVAHINTSMKWRDMQPSWRTMSLLHSCAMLGRTGFLSRGDWTEIYDFLILNLSHLAGEGRASVAAGRGGNHVLQMGTALVIAGILFPELPGAAEWETVGREVMTLCRRLNVYPDGMTKETGPSYSHFIARLYLEAEKTAEANGFAPVCDLDRTVPAMYQRLAELTPRSGVTLPFSDGFGMDARADIDAMAELFPFTVTYPEGSRIVPDSRHTLMECGAMECAVDSMEFQGGHQHYCRMHPLLWFAGEELLTDIGCPSYDWGDFYRFSMSSDAHSVIFADAFPDRKSAWQCEVREFDAASNTLTGAVTVRYGNAGYVWTRTLSLTDHALTVTDTVDADAETDFTGHWHLAPRETASVEGGFRQALQKAVLDIRCDADCSLDRVPGIGYDAKVRYLPRLTWKKRAKSFTVRTEFSVREL